MNAWIWLAAYIAVAAIFAGWLVNSKAAHKESDQNVAIICSALWPLFVCIWIGVAIGRRLEGK